MPNNTKQEELRRYAHMIVNGDTPHDSMMFLQDYANHQVLQAIEKIKSKTIKFDHHEWAYRAGEKNYTEAVPLSAIEAIENEYRNE